jgi:hypothetical protein
LGYRGRICARLWLLKVTMPKPNKSQERAIALVRRFVELDLNKNPEYGHQIVRFDVFGQDRLLRH